jgi:ribonuclease HI
LYVHRQYYVMLGHGPEGSVLMMGQWGQMKSCVWNIASKAWGTRKGVPHIYMDGSRDDNGAGWGCITLSGSGWPKMTAGPVVSDVNGRGFIGATGSSNNTAELSGIHNAVEPLLEEYRDDPRARRVVLRPDSQYALNISRSRLAPRSNTRLGRATRNLILELESFFTTFWWRHVKSHVGNEFNDWADALAAFAVSLSENWEGTPPCDITGWSLSDALT